MCILCSYLHGNNLRLSMYMHTRTGEKPFVCSIRSKWRTMAHGSMVVWIHGKMDPWQFGFMAQWMHSSLDSCNYGCVTVWMHGIFKNIPPRHLRPSKIKTHYVRSPSFTVKGQKLKTPKLSGD